MRRSGGRGQREVMPRAALILIVDDEPAVRTVFRHILAAGEFAVAECADGEAALEYCAKNSPALIVLDVEMPRRDGWSTLQELRRRGHEQPVLILTHVSDVKSVVRGLEAGADGYLGKPCEPAELLARVKALLRRGGSSLQGKRRLRCGEVVVDLERKSALEGETPLGLTRTEFELLELLSESPGKPVAREVIVARIRSGRQGSSQALDTLLWRLRRKLGDTGAEPQWIQNRPGIGYVLPAKIAEAGDSVG